MKTAILITISVIGNATKNKNPLIIKPNIIKTTLVKKLLFVLIVLT